MQPQDYAHTLAQWLLEARSIVVLTGAGISAESGIPTFRDAQEGLWSRFKPEELASVDAYQNDKALVWGWHVYAMATVRAAEPGCGHLGVTFLQRLLGKFAPLKPAFSIVTQNVDDLHERAHSHDVIHVHGDLFAPRCAACERPYEGFEPPEGAKENPRLRLMPPRCQHCGGYIRPGVVWFGESLPGPAWLEASQRVWECDLLLAIGTSGLVYPTAGLPMMAKGRGARVVEINPEATSLSTVADVSWRATDCESMQSLLSEVCSLLFPKKNPLDPEGAAEGDSSAKPEV